MTRLAEAKTSDEFRRPENQPSYEPRHLPALDGIRGIAILMVLLTHLGAILRDVRIIRYFEFGWIGVDLFFVLSGFLITRILLETRTDPQYYRRFYIRRGLRIWPLYYAYLLVMVVLVHALRRMYAHSPGNFGSGGPPVITGPLWMYLFFLQNLRPASLLSSKLSMSITWSLCIEEHFYLVWPVFVRNFAIRTLKYGLLAVLVLSPLMRLGAIFLLRDDGYSVWLRTVGVLTPFHLDAIAAGCLLCLSWPRLSTVHKHFRLFTVCFLLGVTLTIFCLALRRHEAIFSFCYSALALMFAGLVGMALKGWMQGFFTYPFLRYVGKISYGLYLIHPTIFLFLQSHHVLAILGGVSRIRIGDSFAALLAMSLSLLLASLSWRFYEGPVLALKSKLAP
jgi:peptidoglycan/LPS O-acetylase OafA/YrhL